MLRIFIKYCFKEPWKPYSLGVGLSGASRKVLLVGCMVARPEYVYLPAVVSYASSIINSCVDSSFQPLDTLLGYRMIKLNLKSVDQS
jgi:hypothetical protein